MTIENKHMTAQWNDKAQNEGFIDVREAFKYLLNDDWSATAIGNFFGFTNTAVLRRIKLYKLGHLIKEKGGPNNRRCTDQKWRFRARRLGFDNESEMLKAYRLKYMALLVLLKKDVHQNEFNYYNEPCTVHRASLVDRFKKHKILPAYRTSNSKIGITSSRDSLTIFRERVARGICDKRGRLLKHAEESNKEEN